MKTIRTPDNYFKNLPGYDFSSHYIEDLPGYEKIRIHYLDEGASDSDEVFLCLHGQPTWSYLYRKMIPLIHRKGFRVVAPDLIGFGKSDKILEEGVYSFDFHLNFLIRFIKYLDLENITLVVQDWGGLLGLNIPPSMPERFRRLIVMNTFLPTGETPLSQGFYNWRQWCSANPDMPIARLMKRAVPSISDEEAAAYEAPFPDTNYKAAVRAFPNLVPDSVDAPGAACAKKSREWWQNKWRGKSFLAIGKNDPVCGEPSMRELHGIIKGSPQPLIIEEAGHFVQEHGEKVLEGAFRSFGL